MAVNAWSREDGRIINDDTEYVETWKYESNEVDFFVSVRHFGCTWGTMRQVSILKNRLKRKTAYSRLKFDKEPNMSEKCNILKVLRIKYDFINPVPIEVYPKKENIVDNLDMYHIWVLEQCKLPLGSYVSVPNFPFWWSKANVEGISILYKKRSFYQKGRFIKVYFLKSELDDYELAWYDKQRFKDKIIGEDTVAIEEIQQLSNNISILVCIPKKIRLPFGLKKTR